MFLTVPTAERIQLRSESPRSGPFDHPDSRPDLPFILDFERNIPTLPCEVTEGGTQVRFRCGYCDCDHYHSNDPKDSEDKGHRVAHCSIQPQPYPSGYDLRTDLSLIFRQRYPNFAVISRGVQSFNAHYRHCKRLGLPFCAVICKRNYGLFKVDFITANHGMDKDLGRTIASFARKYRVSHPVQKINRLKDYGGFMDETRGYGETSSFPIYVNDAIPVADVLMPIINDRTHWVKRGAWR